MKNLKYSLEADFEGYVDIIVEFFADAKKLTEKKKKESYEEAKELLKNYPFDSVLFVLKHFYSEIGSLAKLNQSWDSYQTKLQKNLNQIDFEKAKKEHEKENSDLKKAAKKWLEQSNEKNMTVEEVRVLEIVLEHQHPRRQLFWAYRFKQNYPNLKMFFLENITRMLPVTTKGGVVKKKD